jgi:hypothetical protein
MTTAMRRRLAKLEVRAGRSSRRQEIEALVEQYLNPCGLPPAEMALLAELEKRASPCWRGGGGSDDEALSRWCRQAPAERAAAWRGACCTDEEAALLAGVLDRVPLEDFDRLRGSVIDHLL